MTKLTTLDYAIILESLIKYQEKEPTDWSKSRVGGVISKVREMQSGG